MLFYINSILISIGLIALTAMFIYKNIDKFIQDEDDLEESDENNEEKQKKKSISIRFDVFNQNHMGMLILSILIVVITPVINIIVSMILAFSVLSQSQMNK